MATKKYIKHFKEGEYIAYPKVFEKKEAKEKKDSLDEPLPGWLSDEENKEDKNIKEAVLKENGDLPRHLVKQITDRANAARKAGATISIDKGLPSIAIKMPDGSDYSFQEHEAEQLLKGVPSNVNEEDYLLATSQEW